jgi:hypothetical protein
MYLVTGTRAGLSFPISFLAECFSARNKQHVAAVKCCLGYINGTRHLTLLFPYGGNLFIARFSDSDYGNCIDSSRYGLGYFLKSKIQQFLGGHRNKNLCPHLL